MGGSVRLPASGSDARLALTGATKGVGRVGDLTYTAQTLTSLSSEITILASVVVNDRYVPAWPTNGAKFLTSFSPPLSVN